MLRLIGLYRSSNVKGIEMKYVFGVALSLALCAGSAFANDRVRPNETLPEIRCDRFNCSLVNVSTNPPTTIGNPPRSPQPEAISSVPVTAAPPAGQRLVWGGLGHTFCANIRDMSPQPTLASPYDYIRVEEIPVPLGSTFAGLKASFESVMAGTTGGSAGTVGLLQIRRTGSTTWENVDLSYALTVPGFPSYPPILYGTGHHAGNVDLAQLAGTGQGTVPDWIDVRYGIYAQYTTAFSTVLTNQACKGRLEVTF